MLVFDKHLQEMICDHREAYIEKACCTTAGDSGYIECACAGRDELICPNPDCTGIEEDQEVNIRGLVLC